MGFVVVEVVCLDCDLVIVVRMGFVLVDVVRLDCGLFSWIVVGFVFLVIELENVFYTF